MISIPPPSVNSNEKLSLSTETYVVKDDDDVADVDDLQKFIQNSFKSISVSQNSQKKSAAPAFALPRQRIKSNIFGKNFDIKV